jgi:hypothetical protein
MEAFKVQYANPLFRLPMTFIEIFPVGVLVSLCRRGCCGAAGSLPARGNVTAGRGPASATPW